MELASKSGRVAVNYKYRADITIPVALAKAILNTTGEDVYWENIAIINLEESGKKGDENWSKERNALEALRVYPNPATNSLTIEYIADDEQDRTLEVIDINGRRNVQTKLKGSYHQLDVSEFTPGIYFLLIKSNGSIVERSTFIITK